MNDKFFLDTNILIYVIDPEDPRKQASARQLLSWGLESELAVISYQVVQEWMHFCLRRAKSKLAPAEASSILDRLLMPLWSVQSSPVLVESALSLHLRYQFSWYDSLIVAAALKANCKTLYSEDLKDGLRVNDLTIKNPFKLSTP
jgi:predicted nucleic acid-binding protein